MQQYDKQLDRPELQVLAVRWTARAVVEIGSLVAAGHHRGESVEGVGDGFDEINLSFGALSALCRSRQS
jgi:hypothetical protein